MLNRWMNTERSETQEILLHINVRLSPLKRDKKYEQPLSRHLWFTGAGKIVGGGTSLGTGGEAMGSDIEMIVRKAKLEGVVSYIKSMKLLPKGSVIYIGDEEHEVGHVEGLAIYLNGTELSDEVYKECDPNQLVSELDQKLTGVGKMLSYWQGRTETALYYYGNSFHEMNQKIEEVIRTNPLCEKCRISRIA